MSDLFGDQIKTAEESTAPIGDSVPVVPLRPVDQPYHYLVPDGLRVQAGDVVAVPFGNSRALGIVWDDDHDNPPPKGTRMKQIASRADQIHIPKNLRKLVDWGASYTLSSIGMVAKMAMPITGIFKPPKPVSYFRPIEDLPVKGLTEQRKAILTYLQENGADTASGISDATGVSNSTVYTMEKAGLLERTTAYKLMQERPVDIDLPKLNTEQEQAAQTLKQHVSQGGFKTYLLDGVTGSGKTEVYLYAVEEAMARGEQVLVMVPEIALTAQFMSRFKTRFGIKPSLWHSTMTKAQRKEVYRAVNSGTAQVIVGARSALFLPFDNLGLIVVDEEHDGSYKQEDQVIYHARDLAVKRGHLEDCPVILSSATPSLESHVNAIQGRYERLHLPDRHAGALMPDIKLIDMRSEPVSKSIFLSPTLQEQVQARLDKGEQSLLFLNRRGYAPLTLCRKCGFRIQCPHCTAWLVEHRDRRRLECHHCGYNDWKPKKCPECEAEDSLTPIGPGVERVRDEAVAAFPDSRIMVLSSDMQQSSEALEKALQAISDGKVDILIGTQILAKGHHFPDLTLVGVIDADLGLSGGDLRASEKTYQLLHQVSGRAGRGKLSGEVYLQTYQPNNRVIQALSSDNRDDFLAVEVEQRKMAGMPPFGRLAAIIISSPDEKRAEQQARALAQAVPKHDTVQWLGPIQAPIYKLRDNYRWRMLIRGPRELPLQNVIQAWLNSAKQVKNCRIQVDIDPQTFF